MKILSIFLLGLLVMGSMALTGCLDDPEETEDTLLRMGFAWPTEIDPATGTDKSSTTAFTNLYDPLVFPTQEGVKPWIAEDWDISEDGTVYTFNIREDVTFHSGRDLTAEDVYFSMERLVTMGEGFAHLFADYIDLDASQVVDDHTVEFVIHEPRGVFLPSLVRLYIVDKEEILENAVEGGTFEYEPWGNDLGRDYLITNDAGSGPYQAYEVVVEDHVYMRRFDDYWGEMHENAPDEFRMLALGEAATERTMFRRGELEITSEWLPYEQVELIAEQEGGVKGAYPEGGAFFGMMHTRKPPLDCVHVRRALAYAYDYDSQIDDIFPESELMQGIVPVQLGGALDLEMPRMDREAAMAELEQSQYYPEIIDNPDDYEIEASWTGEVAATERAASLLGEAGDALGLNVRIARYAWGSLIDAMYDEDESPHVAMVWVTAHYPEAGSLLEARYHSRNARSWEQNEWLQDDEIDSLIDEALSEPDLETRYQLYADIQEKLFELMPSLFLHTQYSMHVMQPYIEWPHVENPEEEALAGIGFNIDLRRIGVTPPGER